MQQFCPASVNAYNAQSLTRSLTNEKKHQRALNVQNPSGPQIAALLPTNFPEVGRGQRRSNYSALTLDPKKFIETFWCFLRIDCLDLRFFPFKHLPSNTLINLIFEFYRIYYSYGRRTQSSRQQSHRREEFRRGYVSALVVELELSAFTFLELELEFDNFPWKIYTDCLKTVINSHKLSRSNLRIISYTRIDQQPTLLKRIMNMLRQTPRK